MSQLELLDELNFAKLDAEVAFNLVNNDRLESALHYVEETRARMQRCEYAIKEILANK